MAHARVSAGKGCMMKVVRTRVAVAIAGSAVLLSGFGLSAFAVSSTSQATTMLTATQSVTQPCPNTTVVDYCTRK